MGCVGHGGMGCRYGAWGVWGMGVWGVGVGYGVCGAWGMGCRCGDYIEVTMASILTSLHY